MNEAAMHDENCFLTLTYEGEQYDNASLNYDDVTKFIKRTRKNIGPFRYFYSGEYGTQRNRPHYHMCMFGLQFNDKTIFKNTDKGHTIYTSETLSNLWKHGFASIGEITMDSAQYAAKYCTDYIDGDSKEENYTRINTTTGELILVEPQQGRMSQNLGIEWIRKYKTDVYGDYNKENNNKDKIIINGRAHKPPKSYDQYLAKEYGLEHDHVQYIRGKQAEKRAHDNTPERLRTREEFTKLKLANKTRSL